jgi:hypothetical protein
MKRNRKATLDDLLEDNDIDAVVKEFVGIDYTSMIPPPLQFMGRFVVTEKGIHRISEKDDSIDLITIWDQAFYLKKYHVSPDNRITLTLGFLHSPDRDVHAEFSQLKRAFPTADEEQLAFLQEYISMSMFKLGTKS